MGDDSLILREDGFLRIPFPVATLTYHTNLNVILLKTSSGVCHVLDVNSGVILQSSSLGADGIEYVPGADRIFLWNQHGVCARTDYNGVLLLNTALQLPLTSSQTDSPIKIELVLSEAVLLYQCLQSLNPLSIEGLSDFIKELNDAIDREPARKGVKAQKWSTATIQLPQSTVRSVMTTVVQELKGQNRRIPALAIASAVGQCANELVIGSRDEDTRALMYSEADRKQTFKRWPHMDYKWALPARMAQAGFYHQPSPSGDDRAMCFTCMVCLVCWEKSDEPWVEHERHSPNCPFVRGEYTHNVPISVTNATACATPCPNVTVVSKGNTGDLVASGTLDGNVNIWKFDCGLKLIKFIHMTPYDSIFIGILSTDCNKVWSESLEKDSCTYDLELTAMTFVGMTNQQEQHTQQNTSNEKETATNKTKPSLICAVTITRTRAVQSDQPIKESDAYGKALFDSGLTDKSKENIKAMNDQNEAKSNMAPTNKLLFLLTYDIVSSLSSSTTTVVHTSNSSGNSKPGGSKKVCAVARSDDANIYDEIYLQYSDDDAELPQCTNNILEEQISHVINLNASSSKEDAKVWQPKNIIVTKHFKVLPPPPPTALLPELPDPSQVSMLDFVGKISQMKSWKNSHLESIGTKLADQTDSAVLQQADPITHYLNMNGPLEISDLKWYEGGENGEKVKITTFGGSKVATQAVNNANNDGFDSDPPQEEATQGVAIQCLAFPTNLSLKDDSRVTHLIPTEDKDHLLVVISTVNPENMKNQESEMDTDNENKMDCTETSVNELETIAETIEHSQVSDPKAYYLLYKINSKTSVATLEDNPVSVKGLPLGESPVDLCLLPKGKHEEYSFAATGVDGCLRMYSLPDFSIVSEKMPPTGKFTSVVYCSSVERLSACTTQGMMYFYALNNNEKDQSADVDEDEFANIDYNMLQNAPKCEDNSTGGGTVIIANKPDLDIKDLEALISLTGSYGTNTTVPYSAVVPGFWCELSPAQRSRSDHQNNRTWRLQNTSSTWDEHILELTLPYSVSLAHIEFGFTLHIPCSVNLPKIQVTLLKQNVHGIGYKKEASFYGQQSPQDTIGVERNSCNAENQVNNEEYVQAHNAEILAGPLLLSSGLDLTQQSGTLILTSPKLYRAKGRTFLIHIKTLFDPAKDINKGSIKSGESSSKKSGFIGCDWLHQISITVRSSPHTNIPIERHQRIAMLESNVFLNNLFQIIIGKNETEKKKLALDLLTWVLTIRLQRLRLAKSDKAKDGTNETQYPIDAAQLECVKIVEKYVDDLMKTLLCSKRSVAKKCTKVLLIIRNGVKQLVKPWRSSFDASLTTCVDSCIPLLGMCDSPGAMRWLTALVMQTTTTYKAPQVAVLCLNLLERLSKYIQERRNSYHGLLKARFGLYGLPLERTIFEVEGPVLSKSTATPITYASMLTGDTTTTTTTTPKPDYQLKDLYNLASDIVDGKISSSNAWWNQSNSVGLFSAGLCESMPLHVTCHMASDGTKLESSGGKHPLTVVSTLPGGDPTQLWTAVKEGQTKQSSQDPDSLEDAENSSLMECDPQEKLDTSEEKLLKEQDQCGIPWAQLVTRPPQYTLLVERMHSGARRYIVLDFGHAVRLTDVIIPCCSDLVTLCIDIWLRGEEVDSTKLAYTSDITTHSLVLSDIQPPPLCRYMKITTIGRYGMAAMKCKIPLGWFYGEIAEVSKIYASINALNALHQDLTCRFRLATGKLIDLLNPYLELYNGNAAHMMAYLNLTHDPDPKVMTAYQDCMELQQQLHTVNNILRKLHNENSNDQIIDIVKKGKGSPDSFLERASTDKLRVMVENVLDMLLYFFFQTQMDTFNHEVTAEWCRNVTPLLFECTPRAAAGLATLLARLCGGAPWWGAHLADTLQNAFAPVDAPPLALDRCLVLVMYMCRKSLLAHAHPNTGVAEALAIRALSLLRSPKPEPTLSAAVLVTLAAALDSAVYSSKTSKNYRWEWVTGGHPGGAAAASSSDNGEQSSPRGNECKLHRRKLHKKLLHQMQDFEGRRVVQVMTDEYQRAQFKLKARMAMLGKRGYGGGSASKPDPEPSCADGRARRLVSVPLARELAQALVAYILAADSTVGGDIIVLAAKVVGRLCASSGGVGLLDASCILGLARLATTLPSWPRHALTTLLQDLIEFDNGEIASSSEEGDEWEATSPTPAPAPAPPPAPAPVSARSVQDELAAFNNAAKKAIAANIALTTGYSLNKFGSFSKPKLVAISTEAIKVIEEAADFQLPLVIESDDSDCEEMLEQHILQTLKRDTLKPKTNQDNNISNISSCADARLESCTEVASEAAARRLLLISSGALAAAVRAPPVIAPRPSDEPSPPRVHPPLTQTLYDVFRHLALEFHYQTDCTFMENVVVLWLTLNGSSWSAPGVMPWGVPSLPSDGPRIRLSSDAVNALLASLIQLENVSLRCWVLSLEALAWMANFPLQTEGSTQTMGRVILESEHFVQAIVKFVTMDVTIDSSITTSEPYLSGASVGAGVGAASVFQSMLSRVICGRGAGSAYVALRCVSGVWQRPAGPGTAYDLHAALLRVAHSLAQMLNERHAQCALELVTTVANLSTSWVIEGRDPRNDSLDGRVCGLLADVLSGTAASTSIGRKTPMRRAVLSQLVQYARRLLAIPIRPRPQPGQSSSSPSRSMSSDESQTDEIKATQQQQATNVDDERKQQATRSPCLADTVLQSPEIMHRLYKTLQTCHQSVISNAGTTTDTSLDITTLKDELFCMVAYLADLASNPNLVIDSLLEYLRKEDNIKLSQAMQQYITRVLDKPEALCLFIEAGGLDLAIDNLTAWHHSQTNKSQGLVASLMNYLKLPPQMRNLSTPASNANKKNQSATVENTNGLFNFAPLCTVMCCNSSAQAADVLLGGHANNNGNSACAARRVRTAAWTYHFFAGDDSSLPLIVNLPYAIELHEVQLQPHLNSLATCPGAVAVEAGCRGTLAPLGPPQNTAGMTYIRLVLTKPFVCTTVQIRLYKPRDSSNMGLLQLKILGMPAFNKMNPSSNKSTDSNNWASVIATCTRAPLTPERWARLASGGALAALTALLSSGRGTEIAHAHQALLAAARAAPTLRATLLDALLHADATAHANAFQSSSSGPHNSSMNSICELIRQICVTGSEGATQAYLGWLAMGAEHWLRARTPLSAALVQTLASVLWILKEERLMDNLEQLITDDLFELVYTWVQDVPESSLLKKSLDAVLCSMCYIRPELFRMLLEQMDIHLEEDPMAVCMESQTDDSKVNPAPAPAPEPAASNPVLRLRSWQLSTVAAAAMSPAATTALLHSKLPSAVVDAITDFSITKLQSIKGQLGEQNDTSMAISDDSLTFMFKTGEIPPMKCVCELVDWLKYLCMDRRLKNWLGGAGSKFWRPLLRLLCYPRPPESSWQEGAYYAQLEENTTRLFAELIACHTQNQKLFASTLHDILESLNCTGPEGISGFTRSLILRLLLSSECATVALRWAGVAGGVTVPGRHPAAYCHALMSLPTRTTVRALLRDHRPPRPTVDETGKSSLAGGAGAGTGAGVARSASDTAIVSLADTYELSVAAAAASKDKRIKDVKNTNLKQQANKKRQNKTTIDVAVQSAVDDVFESNIRVQVCGLDACVSPSVTLAQLSAAVPHVFGPHLTLILHKTGKGEVSGLTWEGNGGAGADSSTNGGVLREFGACGGLALVAARLPRPHTPAPHLLPYHSTHHHDLDWVKLDEQFEEVVEMGVNGDDNGGSCSGVPPHTLLALGLLLKLPGYAEALLDEGARAVHLLRLLLGVTCDEDGRSIAVSGNGSGGWSLGTLPFRVVARLLESAPRGTDEGRALRQLLLGVGLVRLLLGCLAVFTHHKPNSAENSQASNGNSKSEDKSQLYWAKGTGFGTGSTQQSWNVEQALVRQKTEEEHVTVLLQVLAAYMNPGEKWPPEETTQEENEAERGMEMEPDSHDLPPEFVEMVANSSLVPAISSYLRNDSVLDMSRHIPLYVSVLRCARALHSLRSRRLAPALRALPRLLRQMSRTTNAYATKLKMSKKNIFGKMTYSQRFSTTSNSELSEEDEGLALLIADIQATSALMCRSEVEDEALTCPVPRPLGGATREARYIEFMRRLQFETFEMMEECGENGFRFTVPYHFESAVRAAGSGERAHPARMKRLAQEAATLSTSLPLSYSSSVFVRTDTDRLDVMKVLITGPSDTPYANGCFVLDVYFPAEYPATPMLINLETTGRHSVRFNPNLYNDGKVCLSVLNTWHGRPEEKWNAHTSSFLQVLVSIQSLILVPEPYFNEPGYERSRGTRVGNNASLEYNSNIYQACVRWAMLDHLRNPSACFKEVIQAHFWMKRNEIMQTISNWISELEAQSGDERTQRAVQLNLIALKRHYIKMQEELVKLPVPPGLEDLDEPFQLPLPTAVAGPAPASAAAASSQHKPRPPPPPVYPSGVSSVPPPTPAPAALEDLDHDLEKIVAQVLE